MERFRPHANAASGCWSYRYCIYDSTMHKIRTLLHRAVCTRLGLVTFNPILLLSDDYLEERAFTRHVKSTSPRA